MELYYWFILTLLITANVGIILYAYFRYLRYLNPAKGYTYSLSLLVGLFSINTVIVSSHLKGDSSRSLRIASPASYKVSLAWLSFSSTAERSTVAMPAREENVHPASIAKAYHPAEHAKSLSENDKNADVKVAPKEVVKHSTPTLPLSELAALLPIHAAGTQSTEDFSLVNLSEAPLSEEYAAPTQPTQCTEEELARKFNEISTKEGTSAEKDTQVRNILKCFSSETLSILVVERAMIGVGENSWEMKGKPMKLTIKDYLSGVKHLSLGDAIEIDTIQYDNAGKITYIELSEKRKV